MTSRQQQRDNPEQRSKPSDGSDAENQTKQSYSIPFAAAPEAPFLHQHGFGAAAWGGYYQLFPPAAPHLAVHPQQLQTHFSNQHMHLTSVINPMSLISPPLATTRPQTRHLHSINHGFIPQSGGSTRPTQKHSAIPKNKARSNSKSQKKRPPPEYKDDDDEVESSPEKIQSYSRSKRKRQGATQPEYPVDSSGKVRCFIFGRDRLKKYPNSVFCAGCERVDDDVGLGKQINLDSVCYACTVTHPSPSEPNQDRKEHRYLKKKFKRPDRRKKTVVEDIGEMNVGQAETKEEDSVRSFITQDTTEIRDMSADTLREQVATQERIMRDLRRQLAKATAGNKQLKEEKKH